jgi:hypothetical protein
MSKESVFTQCITALTEERILGAFDQELVLRFFAMKNARPLFKHDIEDFLTDYMEDVSDPASPTIFDYKNETAVFLKTFQVLGTALGEEAFAYAAKDRKKLTKSFSVLHFEAISLGIQPSLDSLDEKNNEQMKLLGDTLRTLKMDQTFYDLTTGGGKNSSGQLAARIAAVEGSLAGAGLWT